MSSWAYQRAFAHCRAVFVLFHVTAMIVLSLPSDYVASRARWNTPDSQLAIADWTRRARSIGLDLTQKQFEDKAFGIASRYASVRDSVTPPFALYAHYSGARQGWVMFSNPKRHPSELRIDVIEERGRRTPIYRERSEVWNWHRKELDDVRIRVITDRLANSEKEFDTFADWLGERVLLDFPLARYVEVSVHRVELLPPAAVSANQLASDQTVFSKTLIGRPTP